ncbi:MAG: alpha/beta hydrolase [Pseudoclavibacter sp.]|jgi:pimeloyl-ACP methyl ester carboxylesterase
MDRVQGYAESALDGVRTHYQVFPGDGSPVVLVHGSALSGASWRGLGYVRGLQRAGHRVVIYDVRGHGRSDGPTDPAAYDDAHFVSDFEAVADAVGLARTHVMGYSFGARLALQLAVLHSPRLIGFVELAGSPAAAAGEVHSVFPEPVVARLRADDIHGFVTSWEEYLGAPIDAGTRQALLANHAASLGAFFDGLSRKGATSEDLLRGIEAPSLWIAGTEDHPRFEASQRTAELLGAPFVPLPGRTHANTMFPAQPVLDAVVPFLDRVDAEA